MSQLDDFFDKKYGERMRELAQPDFAEADWPRLSSQLDEAERRRHRTLPMWCLAALGGLLLLSNLLWMANFHSIKKVVEGLAPHRADTVFVTRVEQRVDTVFLTKKTYVKFTPPPVSDKKRLTHEPLPLAAFSEKELLEELARRFPQAAGAFFEKKAGDVPAAATDPLPAKAPADPMAPTGQAAPETNLPAPPPIAQRSPWPLLFDKKPLVLLVKTAETAQTTEPTAEKAAEKKPRLFQNDWWSTSYSGGWAAPVSRDLVKRNGYSVGAMVEYGYRPNRSLWVEASHMAVTCTGDQATDYGIEIPYKIGYRVAGFQTIRGPKKSDRIGLGARWYTREGRPWGRLSVGLGYVWEYQKAFDMRLDWEDLFDPGVSYQEELAVPKEGKAIGYYHADAGIEWRLGRSWLASLTVWKEAKGNHPHGLPGYFGAKAGLGYRF